MENKNNLKYKVVDKVVGVLFLVTGIFMLGEMAYDFYAFIYLEVNQGIWLSPFGLLSPLWFLPIGGIGLMLGVWQVSFFFAWEETRREERNVIEVPYCEFPTTKKTMCPQCGGEVNGESDASNVQT
jgi:hypothetical protein